MAVAKLLVFDYSGTARSGKGTIVKYFCQKYAGRVTAEETGIDYRAITKNLLDSGQIAVGMNGTVVTEAASALGEKTLTDIVSRRPETMGPDSQSSLYSEIINGLVAFVGQSPPARAAVKTCLKHRVSEVAEGGKHEILLLDGRGLASVIEGLNGIKIQLRTFVACSAAEAARRECLRQGIAPKSAVGEEILKSLEDRIRHDEQRRQDAVRPDTDAIDYRHPPALGNLNLASFAVQTGRQIYFDTSDLSLEQMLAAADQMFNDALTKF